MNQDVLAEALADLLKLHYRGARLMTSLYGPWEGYERIIELGWAERCDSKVVMTKKGSSVVNMTLHLAEVIHTDYSTAGLSDRSKSIVEGVVAGLAELGVTATWDDATWYSVSIKGSNKMGWSKCYLYIEEKRPGKLSFQLMHIELDGGVNGWHESLPSKTVQDRGNDSVTIPLLVQSIKERYETERRVILGLAEGEP